MFETLQALPADPILGLISAFKNETKVNKVDLGVGVYKNEAGSTPVMQAVKAAEIELLEQQQTKAYIGPNGNPDFALALAELLLGESSSAIKDQRLAFAQTPGGCGALRVGAELIKAANPKATIWVSDPTWGNHIPLLGNTGLAIKTYPYFDAKSSSLKEEAMFQALSEVPAGDFVLLHASCHNPTGIDLHKGHWQKIAELAQKQGFIPFVDIAYQGFGVSMEEDAQGLRTLVELLPEVLIAASCSKNFGLYRERVGAVALVSANAQIAATSLSHIASIVRGLYSMPPDHGAAVVAKILQIPQLRSQWLSELDEMRTRIQNTRRTFSEQMLSLLGEPRFDFVAQQKGMFSFLGLSPEQVDRLARDYGIYMLSSSRASICGMNEANLAYVCEAVAKICKIGA